MYEISDRYGEVVAVISEKECFSVERGKQLIEAGYKPSEIAILFDTTAQRVNRALSNDKQNKANQLMSLPFHLIPGCKVITRSGLTTTRFHFKKDFVKGRNAWLKENAIRLAEIQHDDFRVFQYQSIVVEEMTYLQQSQLIHYLFDDFSQVVTKQTMI